MICLRKGYRYDSVILIVCLYKSTARHLRHFSLLCRWSCWGATLTTERFVLINLITALWASHCLVPFPGSFENSVIAGTTVSAALIIAYLFRYDYPLSKLSRYAPMACLLKFECNLPQTQGVKVMVSNKLLVIKPI